MVCVPETPLLNVPAAAIVADPVLMRFEKAGEEYALALETVQRALKENEEFLSLLASPAISFLN